jgi:hypothetical protein
MIVALTNAANWLGYHGVEGIEHNFTLQIISILLYILVDFHFADCENAKDWLEAIFHHLD